MDFENEHLSMIEQYENSSSEIERILFTKRYKLSKNHYSLLAIQSISILYSYWEGYIQNSFKLYIEYINSLHIEFRQLSDEIVTFHMENTFKQFRSYPKDKLSKRIIFFNKLANHFSEDYHDIFRSVNTESNVGFSTKNKLLLQFSLQPFPEHWGSYTYPNTNLKETLNTFLRYRNGVAHGGDVSSEEKITQDVYAKYRMLVNDLMYATHDKFLEGIQNRTYMKER